MWRSIIRFKLLNSIDVCPWNEKGLVSVVVILFFSAHAVSIFWQCSFFQTDTFGLCTWASRAGARPNTDGDSIGPWCMSMLMSTCFDCWRRFWRVLHNWCYNFALWSRRTGLRLCSVRNLPVYLQLVLLNPTVSKIRKRLGFLETGYVQWANW